jgi:hypothetical protein
MTVTPTQLTNAFYVSGSTRELTYYNGLTTTLPDVRILVSSSAQNFRIKAVPRALTPPSNGTGAPVPVPEVTFRNAQDATIIDSTINPLILETGSKAEIIMSINTATYAAIPISTRKNINIAFDLVAQQRPAAVTPPPGSGAANGSVCTTDAQCQSGYCTPNVNPRTCAPRPALKQNGQACAQNLECQSLYCNETTNTCAPAPALKRTGEACLLGIECQSGNCVGGDASRLISGTCQP